MRPPHYPRPGTVLTAATAAAFGLILAWHARSVPTHNIGDVPRRPYDCMSAPAAHPLRNTRTARTRCRSSPLPDVGISAGLHAKASLVPTFFSRQLAMSLYNLATSPNPPLCAVGIAGCDTGAARHRTAAMQRAVVAPTTDGCRDAPT